MKPISNLIYRKLISTKLILDGSINDFNYGTKWYNIVFDELNEIHNLVHFITNRKLKSESKILQGLRIL